MDFIFGFIVGGVICGLVAYAGKPIIDKLLQKLMGKLG